MKVKSRDPKASIGITCMHEKVKVWGRAKADGSCEALLCALVCVWGGMMSAASGIRVGRDKLGASS